MRGRKAKPRVLEPDAKYGSVIVTKLINYVMLDGKKDAARKAVYDALEMLGEKTKTEPVSALEQALKNITPEIEVKARRVGGSNYQVPTPVNERRGSILALRWIVEITRKARKDKPYSFYLAQELVAAHGGEGATIKKKEDVERMAESNRAYSQ